MVTFSGSPFEPMAFSKNARAAGSSRCSDSLKSKKSSRPDESWLTGNLFATEPYFEPKLYIQNSLVQIEQIMVEV
jgi:hypothetical protein